MGRLISHEDGSNKFWEGSVVGAELTTSWGRVGTSGQSKTKQFASPAAAEAELAKLVREKLGKGYVEEAGAPKGATPATAKPVRAAKATKSASPGLPAVYGAFLEGRDQYKNLAIANLPTWGERLVPVTFLGKPSKKQLEENEADLSEHPHVTVLATLGPEYSAFLVADLGDEACPVLLWDEGTFHPVTPSLKEFLAKLQKKGTPPRSAPILKAYEKASALSDAGKNAEAVKVLDKALEGVPSAPDANVTNEYGVAVSATFLRRGNCYADMEDRRALEDYVSSLRWGEPEHVYSDPDPALMSQVEALGIQLGDHQAAIDRWNEIKQQRLFIQPAEFAFYIHKVLGYCYLATGKDALAEEEYRAAFEADKGKCDEAAHDLQRYVDRKLPNPTLAAKLLARFEKKRWS